jgi:Holliday junction resolvase RusA-like endonuclease
VKNTGSRIVLSGEPQSTNNIYRYACRGNFPAHHMTKAGRDRKEQYQREARAQWRGKPLEGDIAVDITLFFGTKRKADLDNFNKLSLNALTGIVWHDDSQIAELRRTYDKQRPRIEILIG